MKLYHYIFGAILLIIIYFGLRQKPQILKSYSSQASKSVVFPQPSPNQRLLQKPIIPRELVYDYRGSSTPFPPVGSILSEKTGNLMY